MRNCGYRCKIINISTCRLVARLWSVLVSLREMSDIRAYQAEIFFNSYENIAQTLAKNCAIWERELVFSLV